MGPNNDLWDSDEEQPAAGAAGGAAASAAGATSDEDAVATSDDDGGGGAAAAGATSSKVKLLVCEWCGLTSKDRDLFPGKQNNETQQIKNDARSWTHKKNDFRNSNSSRS